MYGVPEFKHGPCLAYWLRQNEAHQLLLAPAYCSWVWARAIFSMRGIDGEEHWVGTINDEITRLGLLPALLVRKICRGLLQNPSVVCLSAGFTRRRTATANPCGQPSRISLRPIKSAKAS